MDSKPDRRWGGKLHRGLVGAVVALGFVRPVMAARFELVPKVGYDFHGSQDLAGPVYDRVRTESHSVHGLSFGYFNQVNGQLEVSWTHSDTTAHLETAAGFTPDVFDVGVDQFHMNGLFMGDEETFQPYGLFGLGATRYSSEHHSDHLGFSFALGGGAKWLWNDHLGLRFEGKWIPMYAPRGTHIFCADSGTAGCASTDANSYIARQFPFISTLEFTTGLIIRY